MNDLAKRPHFVQEVKRVPGLSNFLGNLHTKAITTRSRRLFNPAHRYPNFPGAPARQLAQFIPLYVKALARNAHESGAAGPNVNMGNAEAKERRARNAARARAQANANRRAGQRIAEQAARNAAAEAVRLRRAAEEANARARDNAVNANRRRAAAERAARSARNAAGRAARNAAERAARNAAERAARNAAAAQAARNAAAAASAAARAHKAQTNAAAANAARRAKVHANAAAAAAAGGAGGSAGTNAAKDAKKAAKNAETAARTAEKMKMRENADKAFEAQVNAVRESSRRFKAYKAAPHFMTTRQIITRMARNNLGVNIPVNAVVTKHMMARIHPDHGKNVRTKAIRQVLSSALGEYFQK